MARYIGKNAAVYISTTGAGAASRMSAMTGFTVDGSTDKVDATAAGDANIVRFAGLPDRKGDITALWDDTDTKLYAAIDSADGCKLYLYPDVTNKAGSYWYGPAFIDAKMDVGYKDMVKVSGSYVANGNWGRNGI